MIRPIEQMGAPVLAQVAREVSREELALPSTQQLIDDMIQTLKSTTGVGLAAPQVGESVRIVIVDKPMTVLVNPVLTPVSTVMGTAVEACLSVPDVSGAVRRYQTVLVSAMDRKGKAISATWTKFRSIVVQHEVDHLDGILFVQRTEIIKAQQKPAPVAPSAPGKRTIVIESPHPVGGNQHVTFRFDEAGCVNGLRIQPGGATVTGATLSNVRMKNRNYPAGAAEKFICGDKGLHVAPGDWLQVNLKMPGNKRKIIAEADFDPQRQLDA